MTKDPKPPRGPAAWRLYGLLAMLAIIAVLLLFRGCQQEPPGDVEQGVVFPDPAVSALG